MDFFTPLFNAISSNPTAAILAFILMCMFMAAGPVWRAFKAALARQTATIEAERGKYEVLAEKGFTSLANATMALNNVATHLTGHNERLDRVEIGQQKLAERFDGFSAELRRKRA